MTGPLGRIRIRLSSIMLPDELLLVLNDQISCREVQIRQLLQLLGSGLPSPPTIVLHGLEATGKSLTISRILEHIDVPHAIVKSRECITTRHLLERILASSQTAIKNTNDGPIAAMAFDGRCENISALTVHLRCLLEGVEKFILVLDGLDAQREITPTLFPAIARLGEVIPNLTTALIVTSPNPRLLHFAGTPHIHFPPYSRSESLAIVSSCPLSISPDLPRQISPDNPDEDSTWLWGRFTAAVWDSLGKGCARDIVSFRNVCHRLWRPFVQPILDGTYDKRDFSRLMVRNRSLFQSEAALTENIIPVIAVFQPTVLRASKKEPHSLPYITTYLLIAAYLASYNPARLDTTFFAKTSERVRRKKGGGTAAPRHRTANTKHRKIQRRLLGPQPFVLERMLAIFHAILSDRVVASSTADLLTQVATLAGLRLLIRAGAGAGAGADVLDGQAKWRVNVGGEYVLGLARRVGFELESYLAE